MTAIAELAGQLAAIAGMAVMTLCVLAILRFEDVNAKIHAASLLSMAAAPLVLLYPILAGGAEVTLRVLLVMAFSALTGPLSTHALARMERAVRTREGRRSSGE